jgi:hypothetical protein
MNRKIKYILLSEFDKVFFKVHWNNYRRTCDAKDGEGHNKNEKKFVE